MATKTEAKRTPAELISLDAGQVCRCCDAVPEGGDLCWFCEDEQKMLRYERGF